MPRQRITRLSAGARIAVVLHSKRRCSCCGSRSYISAGCLSGSFIRGGTSRHGCVGHRFAQITGRCSIGSRQCSGSGRWRAGTLCLQLVRSSTACCCASLHSCSCGRLVSICVAACGLLRQRCLDLVQRRHLRGRRRIDSSSGSAVCASVCCTSRARCCRGGLIRVEILGSSGRWSRCCPCIRVARFRSSVRAGIQITMVKRVIATVIMVVAVQRCPPRGPHKGLDELICGGRARGAGWRGGTGLHCGLLRTCSCCYICMRARA